MATQQKINLISMLQDFTHTRAANQQQNMAKTIQGHISKILENDFLEFTIDATGPFTLPTLQIPQAFSKYHREPTQVGDKGYYVSNDYYLGGESGNDGGTASMYPRGNLTTGTFHPISTKSFEKRDPNMFLVTGGPSGHTIQSQNHNTFKLMDALGNLLHNAANGIIHHSGSLLFNNPAVAFPIPSGLRGIVHLAGNVLQGGALPIPSGLAGILHLSEGGIAHIADNALNAMVPSQFQGIVHLAQQAITHKSLNGTITLGSLAGMINLVPQQGVTIGAPSSTSAFDLSPPQPTQPTTLNVIGTISASVNMLAGGIMGAAGGFAGTAGGYIPGAGSMGEMISSNITIGEPLTTNTVRNVTSIQLTPGIWCITGEVWFVPSAGVTSIMAGINSISATLPFEPDVGVSRSQAVFSTTTPANKDQILSLRPCYVNLIYDTTYYLVAEADFSGNCTVMGNIYAMRPA